MPNQTVIPVVYGHREEDRLVRFTDIPHGRLRRLQRAETGARAHGGQNQPGIRGERGHAAAHAHSPRHHGAAQTPQASQAPPGGAAAGDPGHTVDVSPVEPGQRGVLNLHLTGASR